MDPVFEKNLHAIGARFPQLLEELKSAFLNPIPNSEVELNTSIDSDWVRKFQNLRSEFVISTGFGNGEHIEQALAISGETVHIAILLVKLDGFIQVLQSKNFEHLLKNPRLSFHTAFGYRESVATLNAELVAKHRVRVLAYPILFQADKELYENILDALSRQIINRWNQIKTDVENAEMVFSNTLENLAEVGFTSDVFSLENAFSGLPLVLVGAGPSLDESYEFLKAAKGKAVICVVNSAYRAVVNQGLAPDITLAVDPKEDTLKGYHGVATDGPILIASYLVFPKVVKLFRNKVYALSSHNPVMTLIRKTMRFKDEPGLIGDGTVSSTVVNMAAFMGCSKVYLVGQDMAIREDGKVHTQDSFYTDEAENFFDPKECEWVPANDGSKVPVEPKLHAYLRLFENQVSHYSGIEFINLSAKGARIHGAKYMPLQEAITQITTLDEHDFNETLHGKLERNRYPAQTVKALKLLFEKYLSYLDKLEVKLIGWLVSVEKEPKLQQKTLNEIRGSRSDVFEGHSEMMAQYQSTPLFASILGEGKTKKEYADFISSEEPWSIILEMDVPISRLLPQGWAILEGLCYQKQEVSKFLSRV